MIKAGKSMVPTTLLELFPPTPKFLLQVQMLLGLGNHHVATAAWTFAPDDISNVSAQLPSILTLFIYSYHICKIDGMQHARTGKL